MSHRIHITREGIYYLFVLAFVIGGAVFREVNLLLVIAAIMIGPIVFSWRLVAASLTRLSLSRIAPPTVAAGVPLPVEVVVSNGRKRWATWALEVQDRIESDTPAEPSEPRIAKVLVPCVPAGQSSRTHYLVRPSRRGRLRFSTMIATTRFPWGFVSGRIRKTLVSEVLVTPQLGTLTPNWVRLIGARESASAATDRSRSSGQRRGLTDGDYYGLRDWRPGDSRRWIHWRTSAKVGGMAVLQFEQRRNRDLVLIVDLWMPENASREQRIAGEMAVSFASTAIVDVCRRANGKLMVAVVAAREGIWERTASSVFAQELLEQLAVVRGCPEPSFDGIAGRIVHSVLPGTKVVVVSTRPRFRGAFGALNGTIECEWIDTGSSRIKDFFQLAN